MCVSVICWLVLFFGCFSFQGNLSSQSIPVVDRLYLAQSDNAEKKKAIQEDSCQELASVVMEKIYMEEISMEVQLKE